ncbi:MAG: MSMEG_4193 family putative phosphomutase [Microthrixaceae bacterium]|nr:MSMEG_4193 family putative phosphomutase [Microthrixaceae bacterium]
MPNPSAPPSRSAEPDAADGDDHGTSTLVLLVRHGLTEQTGSILYGRAPDNHLSEAGRAQADAVAERISTLGDRVRFVVSSDIERTRETAAPIAEALGVGVEHDDGLLEADFGDWTGRPLKELRSTPEWPSVQQHPSTFRFPGGESFVEMQHRMVSTVQRWAERATGGAVVLVSHADLIKTYVAFASGTHLDQFQRLVISPTSVTPILLGAGSPIVLAVNSTGGDLNALAPA